MKLTNKVLAQFGKTFSCFSNLMFVIYCCILHGLAHVCCTSVYKRLITLVFNINISVKEIDLESNAVLGLFKCNNYFNLKMN